MTDDLVKRLNEDFSVNAREDIQHQMKIYEAERKEAADRIEAQDKRNKELEAALRKIAAVEDEHINAPKTDAEANLWTILAVCVDLAEAALGEKKNDQG